MLAGWRAAGRVGWDGLVAGWMGGWVAGWLGGAAARSKTAAMPTQPRPKRPNFKVLLLAECADH